MGTAGVGCDFCLQEGGVGGNLLPFSVFLFLFFLSVFFFSSLIAEVVDGMGAVTVVIFAV